MKKLGTLYGADFFIDTEDKEVEKKCIKHMNMLCSNVNITEARVLKEYFDWCAENGMAKNSVKVFAKQKGIEL